MAPSYYLSICTLPFRRTIGGRLQSDVLIDSMRFTTRIWGDDNACGTSNTHCKANSHWSYRCRRLRYHTCWLYCERAETSLQLGVDLRILLVGNRNCVHIEIRVLGGDQYSDLPRWHQYMHLTQHAVAATILRHHVIQILSMDSHAHPISRIQVPSTSSSLSVSIWLFARESTLRTRPWTRALSVIRGTS